MARQLSSAQLAQPRGLGVGLRKVEAVVLVYNRVAHKIGQIPVLHHLPLTCANRGTMDLLLRPYYLHTEDILD